eukprot:GHVT01105460.1.p1 GENE.GHVT01105460.1~~GHVT01105460.1.p1  ORF type:complete len:130 (-),score=1.13 GHVT01105460.1:324-713(-)
MFKQYSNKSSVLKFDTRYTCGGYSEISPLKIKWWERKIFKKEEFSDRKFVITSAYKYRPDLISQLFFGRPDLGWIILQYNDIVDIIEELDVNKTITIPSSFRTMTTLLTDDRPANAATTANNNPTKIKR